MTIQMTKAQVIGLKGVNIKVNNFSTTKGYYTISIKQYCGDLYFYKTLNGEIVECYNLTENMIHE